MTTDNERLVDYLGLTFELCYLQDSRNATWVLADKIRRKDDVALEILRIFNRFVRVRKSLDKAKQRRKDVSEVHDGDDAPNIKLGPSNNAPYADCIGVRIRIQKHVAAFHVRPGSDPKILDQATQLASSILLDANVQW